jgi:hypothetical protein
VTAIKVPVSMQKNLNIRYDSNESALLQILCLIHLGYCIGGGVGVGSRSCSPSLSGDNVHVKTWGH